MLNGGPEKMEKIDAAAIKKLIHAKGIDLVGIADAQNLILAYPPRPATDLMPTAKSVIVMAVAHSLGSVYSPDIMLWTRSKMQTSRLLDETPESIENQFRTGGVKHRDIIRKSIIYTVPTSEKQT